MRSLQESVELVKGLTTQDWGWAKEKWIISHGIDNRIAIGHGEGVGGGCGKENFTSFWRTDR